ncbi:MAG: HAMP domain-containing histidine kinase [Oscillospiraceae bacterium]|nr:HAMP domain-containing histidine kinase [Oscillospiraceae bacterium]
MIKKLRWKFVLISMLLAALVLVTVTGFFIATTRDALAEDSISVLRRVIDREETPGWEMGSQEVTLPYFAVLIRPDGGAELTDSLFYDMNDRDLLLKAINAALDQPGEQGLLEEFSFRYLKRACPEGWRLAFVDVSYERSTLHQAVANALLVGGGVLIVFFFAAMALAGWAVAPVQRAWEQQRRFVSDASHELKTPLTVILSNAELMERNSRDLPLRDQRWLANIRAGGEQMRQLTEQLLTLARSEDEERREAPFRELDFSDLVQTEALMFEAAAFEAGLTLDCSQVVPGQKLWGEEGKLRHLLDILLDNGVKYAQTGGTITLRLSYEGRYLRLEVTNPGQPIPEQELDRIFDRFYRSDSARSSEGFGLGLAIARAIAEEHRGKLWARSDPEGWNTFILTLPVKSRQRESQ